MIDEIKKYKSLSQEHLDNTCRVGVFKRNDPIYTFLMSTKETFRTDLNTANTIYGTGSYEAFDRSKKLCYIVDVIIAYEKNNIDPLIERNQEIYNQIEQLRQYCKSNYSPYEYYNSEIADSHEREKYFLSNNLYIHVVLNPNTGEFIQHYYLQKDFDFYNLDFIKNINPYLENNYVINGMSVKKYTYRRDSYSIMFYDEKWHIVDGHDLTIFSDESIVNAFKHYKKVK